MCQCCLFVFQPVLSLCFRYDLMCQCCLFVFQSVLSLCFRYDLMCQCWCEEPADRPTFQQLRQQLEHLLSRNCEYLEIVYSDLQPQMRRDTSASILQAAAELFDIADSSGQSLPESLVSTTDSESDREHLLGTLEESQRSRSQRSQRSDDDEEGRCLVSRNLDLSPPDSPRYSGTPVAVNPPISLRDFSNTAIDSTSWSCDTNHVSESRA